MTELQKGKGRIVDPIDERDHLIRQYLAPRPTPARFSRMHQLGPTLDQGDFPKCVTHGASTVKCQQERRDHRRTYVFDVHELYRLCKLHDGIPHAPGTYTRVALDLMHTVGYARMGKPWETDAARYKIKAYARLRTIAEIEETIRHIGPVLIGMDWLRGWTSRSLLLDTPAQIINDGGHLMVLGAYDRPAGRMRLRQSWGEDAHDHGEVDITYRELERQMALPEHRSADVWSVVDSIT